MLGLLLHRQATYTGMQGSECRTVYTRATNCLCKNSTTYVYILVKVCAHNRCFVHVKVNVSSCTLL